jgi:hypothetical protein
MSSTVFEVVLRPDPALREMVDWTGSVFYAVGITLLVLLPVSPWWRFVCSVFWLLDGIREFRKLRLGRPGVRAIVLDSRGLVAGIDGYGDRHDLTLQTGSMVLSRLAWIRVQSGTGNCHGELFTRQSAGTETWHRLQLLWHQSRESFGHQPGP